MLSPVRISPNPKDRPWHTKKVREQSERKHLNKKFYNSPAWRNKRTEYITRLTEKIYHEIPKGYWILKDGVRLEVEPHQSSYLLSLDYIPCETCIKLYLADAYDKVTEAKELDHIIPINPKDALISEGFGPPLDNNNLQYLCRRHHARKSQREK